MNGREITLPTLPCASIGGQTFWYIKLLSFCVCNFPWHPEQTKAADCHCHVSGKLLMRLLLAVTAKANIYVMGAAIFR